MSDLLLERILLGEVVGRPDDMLRALGIDVSKLKDEIDARTAAMNLIGRTRLMFKRIQAATGNLPGFDEADAVLKKAEHDAVRAIAPETTGQSSGEHPATGFEDDPNEKTRGTKYPNRSYRAG